MSNPKTPLIGIIGDIHYDKRGADIPQVKRINEGLQKALQAAYEDFVGKGIKNVFVMGDVFDCRVNLSVDHVIWMRRFFLERDKVTWYIIQGNHDSYFENEPSVSSVELLHNIAEHVVVYLAEDKEPTKNSTARYQVEIGGFTFDVFPWVFPCNRELVEKYLSKQAKAPAETREKSIIMGHFDTFGVMRDHNISDSGIDPNKFWKASPLTISGHYHIQTESGNGKSRIVYVGSLAPYTNVSIGEKHGWWVLNDDLSMDFTENTISPNFVSVFDYNVEEWQGSDFSNSFVKLSIKAGISAAEDMKLTEILRHCNPAKTTITRYGAPSTEESVEETVEVVQEDDAMVAEAQRVSTMTEKDLLQVYMDGRKAVLPKLITKPDTAAAVIGQMMEWTEQK
jgi:DNA repair exonuclease SbcCD nuclease subunit